MKLSSEAIAPAEPGSPVTTQLHRKVSAAPTARQVTALLKARACDCGVPTTASTVWTRSAALSVSFDVIPTPAALRTIARGVRRSGRTSLSRRGIQAARAAQPASRARD